MGRTKSPAPPQIPLASFSAHSPSCRPLGDSLRDLCWVVADPPFRPTSVSFLPSHLHKEGDAGNRKEEAKNQGWGASLVAQWLGIHLPVQGTWVQALVWEDPTCRGATEPVGHNY